MRASNSTTNDTALAHFIIKKMVDIPGTGKPIKCMAREFSTTATITVPYTTNSQRA
jgi:hypothetical protein